MFLAFFSQNPNSGAYLLESSRLFLSIIDYGSQTAQTMQASRMFCIDAGSKRLLPGASGYCLGERACAEKLVGRPARELKSARIYLGVENEEACWSAQVRASVSQVQ